MKNFNKTYLLPILAATVALSGTLSANFEDAGKKVDRAAEKVADKALEVKDKAVEKAHDAKDKAVELKDKAADKAYDTVHSDTHHHHHKS